MPPPLSEVQKLQKVLAHVKPEEANILWHILAAFVENEQYDFVGEDEDAPRSRVRDLKCAEGLLERLEASMVEGL